MSESQQEQESPPPPVLEGNQTIQVTLKTLDDRELTVRIGLQDTIQTLIDMARDQLSINTGFQRVIAGGRVLNSSLTMQASGIVDGQTVHLVDRGPSIANERPNVTPDRPMARMIVAPSIPPAGFIIPTATQALPISRIFPGSIEALQAAQAVAQHQLNTVSYTMLHPIRVPGSISGDPVLSSLFADECIDQTLTPLRTRENWQSRPPIVGQQSNPFLTDPNAVQWAIRIVDDIIFRPRETIEQIIRDVINGLSFLDDEVKNSISLKWEAQYTMLFIHFPVISPHIPSPALEKLDFLCLWTDHLKRFIDKLEEHDGLVAAIRVVLEMVKARQTEDNLNQQGRDQRFTALNAIIKELEIQWAELCHMKDFERYRFRRNQTEEYRNLKIQEYPETPRNPRFFMRHALDIDAHEVMREFRKQRLRFARLEDILDDLNDLDAVKFVRATATNADYRYQSLSMFYIYMQRMRHQLSHITHLISDFDTTLITSSSPQRLFPQYATNALNVPFPHAGTLLLKFRNLEEEGMVNVGISSVMEPPRVLSDIVGRANGDWPYLPYHPPSVHMESVMQPSRRIADPRTQQTMQSVLPVQTRPITAQHFVLQGNLTDAGGLNLMAATDPVTGMSLQELLNQQQEQLEAIATQAVEGARVRVSARASPRRFVATAGDAPSVPVETLPPPLEQQPGPSFRRTTSHRFNVQPEARGAETETLAPYPVAIEPSELQRISRNIASRYRAEALQRIAANLTERFNNESWDTRIQNMPLCTLRECVALALEMLSSAGNTVNESRDLMLALVRDEDVLVRAIAECVKSLFGRGEFPTHVARIIAPVNQAASARNDYEPVDGVEDVQSDEYDLMIVRVPSDISQPQSGDLRAIRQRRQFRRQFLENRGRIPTSFSAPSTSATPPGPSFNSEDTAEIRAGRLPLGTRNRRTVRETVHPAAAARAESQSPNSISVTLTATAHPVPAAALNQLMMAANIPSTSSGPSGGWTEQVHIPIRQVVSPTPTTRGLFEFDVSGGSDPNARSTPSPPAPTPRTTSAPATVQSSPTRQEPMESDSSENTHETRATAAARQNARAARARIYHLAAAFNGNLADSRPQNTSVSPNPAAPLNDPRRRPARAQSQNTKPMIAIDPFMHCTSRHCEFNRFAAANQVSDGDRSTLQLLQPDPDFERYIQGMIPTERRPAQISTNDEDYNYEIKRTQSGQFSFQNIEEFRKFLKTTIRNLLATCIDTDTLITMNMNGISGYHAANHSDIIRMVKDHVSRSVASRSSPNINSLENIQAILNEIERNTRRDFYTHRLQQNRNSAGGPGETDDTRTVFSMFPPAINLEQEILIPGHISSLLSNLVDYMENSANPRPPGVFGLLLELTYGRLTRHDFAQLARLTTARNVVSEFEGDIRRHIRDNYLGGRSSLTNAELHRIAETLANNERFFTKFMEQNNQLASSFIFGTDRNNVTNVVWAFRQIEIAFIKSLLTLSQKNLIPDTVTSVRLIMQSVDNYLYRNLIMFYLLSYRNMERTKMQMKRISDYFAEMRYENSDRTGINIFIDNWNRVIEYWHSKYTDFSENNFSRFMLRARSNIDWNDTIFPDARPSAVSIPSLSSNNSASSSQPSVSTASSSTSSSSTVANNNPRKRNHDGSGEGDDDCVDVVAPMMTSLSTSSPLASSNFIATSTSEQPGTYVFGLGEGGPSTSSGDESMQ